MKIYVLTDSVIEPYSEFWLFSLSFAGEKQPSKHDKEASNTKWVTLIYIKWVTLIYTKWVTLIYTKWITLIYTKWVTLLYTKWVTLILAKK